jgi:ferrous iron transport protein B
MSEAPSRPSCSGCPVHNAEHLARLGFDLSNVDYVVALAGNPNVGKSTVFNNLTGLRQHTGNWPGKTVTRAEGGCSIRGHRFKLVDLPGTYSLMSTSTDEEIARDFILFGRPDVTVVVADATRLERNLNLILQILEISAGGVVVCLNLTDEARRNGIEIDERALARDLGVPVVSTAARYNEGMGRLAETIADVAEGAVAVRPRRLHEEPAVLKRALEDLTGRLERAFPGLPNLRWVALRLLAGDRRLVEAVRTGELARLAASTAAVRAEGPAEVAS